MLIGKGRVGGRGEIRGGAESLKKKKKNTIGLTLSEQSRKRQNPASIPAKMADSMLDSSQSGVRHDLIVRST